jgi:energy-coupling factor transporter ATP-binding protein EcfA2
MKVKELYIKDYHQFEDFRLDLTYPEGHPKAGQPLDKVCFIGQSGTGKTSLLNIMSRYFYNLHFFNRMAATRLSDMRDDTTVDGISMKFQGAKHIESSYIDNYISLALDGEGIFIANALSNEFHRCNPVALFFPVDFTNNVGTLKDVELYRDEENLFLFFSGLNYGFIWQKINEQIVQYREQQIEQSLAVSEVTKKIGVKSEEILEAAKKYQEWEQQNINPLKDLADTFLDRILNKFNLRVNPELDFKKIEDVKAIKIETLDGHEVLYDFQSTGTRQVLLSMLPLYTLKPNRTAIFFDEPERSLYPDIQKEIVDIYTSLTTDCQFFYATHSPIIASSFEPWEIVELKFNPKTGKVYQELYYEGERHVDNYTINPQYLRWDDILQRVFDLDSEGNEKRVKALMKLATLESKLKKKDITSEEKEKLWNEYLKLSKLTGWTTRMTNEKN